MPVPQIEATIDINLYTVLESTGFFCGHDLHVYVCTFLLGTRAHPIQRQAIGGLARVVSKSTMGFQLALAGLLKLFCYLSFLFDHKLEGLGTRLPQSTLMEATVLLWFTVAAPGGHGCCGDLHTAVRRQQPRVLYNQGDVIL